MKIKELYKPIARTVAALGSVVALAVATGCFPYSSNNCEGTPSSGIRNVHLRNRNPRGRTVLDIRETRDGRVDVTLDTESYEPRHHCGWYPFGRKRFPQRGHERRPYRGHRR